eukprot:gene4838-9642_t
MGLRGLTVIAASGDAGVQGVGKGSDGEQCGKPRQVWPASSPYVTAVGATQLTSGGVEIACSTRTGADITSGGGFSGVNDRSLAPWQHEVVNRYLNMSTSSSNSSTSNSSYKIPLISHFNSTGRGYPDVALIGNDYQFIFQRFTSIQSGTSASAPVFAGIISLLNDKRLSQGMPPLGFANPFLYWAYKKDSTAFTDITNGDNACGSYHQSCCDYGYSTAPGWDALTGLGSPNFTALAVLVMSYNNLPPLQTTQKNSSNSNEEIILIGNIWQRVKNSITTGTQYARVLIFKCGYGKETVGMIYGRL